MPESRILVAVSTPWASDKLCTLIHDLARRLEAHVLVAHVAKATEDDDNQRDIRQRGEQTLSTLTTQLVEAGIRAEGILLFGDDVAQAVLNAAKDQNATLIVLGLSGKSRMMRLLAGDIPQQVIRKTHLPVLVLPSDWSGTI